MTKKINIGIEAIWLKIKKRGSQILEVMNLYRPPGTDTAADICLLKNIKEISSRPDIVLMGNFNAPSIRWNDLQAQSSNQSTLVLIQHSMFVFSYHRNKMISSVSIDGNAAQLNYLRSTVPLNMLDAQLLQYHSAAGYPSPVQQSKAVMGRSQATTAVVGSAAGAYDYPQVCYYRESSHIFVCALRGRRFLDCG
ncbi:unnamed protein product [Schistocephalus solidus]|uniref:Endo/exonuclease/phosphatase domain-containing protein n=1 Tax=Schistocephalus solidus TaxID=70667 RepID=A0A183TKR9_SCHSO|nr:unnamed protein product [Schistocephalus solidus]